MLIAYETELSHTNFNGEPENAVQIRILSKFAQPIEYFLNHC